MVEVANVAVEDVGALAYELAIAPVRARTTTRLRTMFFMVFTPFLVALSGWF
jgi:hypothetical protein